MEHTTSFHQFFNSVRLKCVQIDMQHLWIQCEQENNVTDRCPSFLKHLSVIFKLPKINNIEGMDGIAYNLCVNKLNCINKLNGVRFNTSKFFGIQQLFHFPPCLILNRDAVVNYYMIG
jgi:hypothetical protein